MLNKSKFMFLIVGLLPVFGHCQVLNMPADSTNRTGKTYTSSSLLKSKVENLSSDIAVLQASINSISTKYTLLTPILGEKCEIVGSIAADGSGELLVCGRD